MLAGGFVTVTERHGPRPAFRTLVGGLAASDTAKGTRRLKVAVGANSHCSPQDRQVTKRSLTCVSADAAPSTAPPAHARRQER